MVYVIVASRNGQEIGRQLRATSDEEATRRHSEEWATRHGRPPADARVVARWPDPAEQQPR